MIILGGKKIDNKTTKEEKCAKMVVVKSHPNERIVWDKIIQKLSWRRWDTYWNKSI